METAKLILIPVPIADGALTTLSPEVASGTANLRHFMVENLRTARRFLKALHPSIVIDELQFSEIDKHSGADLKTLRQWLKAGHSIGLMSESGCPGIADPGADVVAVAQQMGAEVVPLVGPNSLMLALMASGLNGQSFSFQGYLPVKEPARSQRIKHLEQVSRKEQQPQIFIETPYRNNQLLNELLRHCQKSTRLCIAQDITGSGQMIKTKTVGEWGAAQPVLEKKPTVFLFLG